MDLESNYFASKPNLNKDIEHVDQPLKHHKDKDKCQICIKRRAERKQKRLEKEIQRQQMEEKMQKEQLQQ